MSVAAFLVERRVRKAISKNPPRQAPEPGPRLTAAPEKVDDEREP